MQKLIYPNFPEHLIKSQRQLNRYIKFIDSRPIREKIKFKTAHHHKTPKSLNGSNIKENIICLTHREHYIAHMILWKAFGGKMSYVFFMMHNFKKNKYGSGLTSKQYTTLKKEAALRISSLQKGQTPWNKNRKQTSAERKQVKEALNRNGTSYGRKGVWPEERKEQARQTREENETQIKDYKYSEESKRKRKERMIERGTTDGVKKGYKHSEEVKQKAQLTRKKNGTCRKGVPWTEEQKKKQRNTRKKNNHGIGTFKWITDELIDLKTDINEVIPRGFRRGRKKINKVV